MKNYHNDKPYLSSSLKKLDSEFGWIGNRKQEIERKVIKGINSEIGKSKIKGRLQTMIPKILTVTLLFFGLYFINSYVVHKSSSSLAEKEQVIEVNENVSSDIKLNAPQENLLDDNRIELQKHPEQIGAYLNLVAAYNKGNLNTYLQSYSNKLPSDLLEKVKADFTTGVTEKHQFSSSLDYIFSNKKTSILLSSEIHAFNSLVSYSLDSYVILNKEDGEWKVLEKIPYKKVGKGDFGSKNDFEKAEAVRKQIEETYNIIIEK